ncbi:MAG: transketolase [Planctomycetes bacterium]|nr:transketolase [Planctomycetota bacterium]
MTTADLWRPLAQRLRADSIRCTTAAGSGHPSSSLSAADLMAVLAASHLRFAVDDPRLATNDHLVFSKGHASPLLYSLLKAIGLIGDTELMSLRTRGSRLEGHPTPSIPAVDAATGSLGQGLAIAVGMALSGKRIEHLPYRCWVLLGDSEMSEGSIWEAFATASHYLLDNLIAIIDVNRLGQRGETALGWHTEIYEERARAFGWNVILVDGHDHAAIDRAYRDAAEAGGHPGQPTCIVARTIKGKGVSFIADQDGWHGKALSIEESQRALAEIGAPESITVLPARPEAPPSVGQPPPSPLELPKFAIGSAVATRHAYGEALRALGASRADVVALDGEVSNSTYADIFKKAFPDRFFEMYIAEQQLVSATQGISARGIVAFSSTFAAFLSRAHDQLRMAAVSRADLRLCGSHAGVSIGEDGPSQMALEDIAMLRALHGSTVLYPCDAVSTAQLVVAMADLHGISYVRTTREKTPVLYPAGERFPIGGCKRLRSSASDRATIIAAGITVHEALKAADALARDGVAVRVIDLYSVKPLDARALREAADETGRLIVVEDHRPEGGIGEAVAAALTIDGGRMPLFRSLAVRAMPGSASPAEQLEIHGISARAIEQAAHDLIGRDVLAHDLAVRQ